MRRRIAVAHKFVGWISGALNCMGSHQSRAENEEFQAGGKPLIDRQRDLFLVHPGADSHPFHWSELKTRLSLVFVEYNHNPSTLTAGQY